MCQNAIFPFQSLSTTFPSLLHSILGNRSPPFTKSHTFQVPLAPPSQAIHPSTRFPHIGRSINQGISLAKTIIPVIACSWKSMDIIGYHCPTMDLLLDASPTYYFLFHFLFLLKILVANFNHPIEHVKVFLYQAHNFH